MYVLAKADGRIIHFTVEDSMVAVSGIMQESVRVQQLAKWGDIAEQFAYNWCMIQSTGRPAASWRAVAYICIAGQLIKHAAGYFVRAVAGEDSVLAKAVHGRRHEVTKGLLALAFHQAPAIDTTNESLICNGNHEFGGSGC